MPKDDQYPYGYQLSFLERTRLRLKKANYRLSLGISISFFLLGVGMILTKKLVPDPEFQYWRDFWGACLFLLFGLQGLLWMITGEIKKAANLTSRGKWVTRFGFVIWIVCWSVMAKIVLNAAGMIR